MKLDKMLEKVEDFGDSHVLTSYETPLREDAFVLSDDEKIALIKDDIHNIMQTLGLDLTDDSL